MLQDETATAKEKVKAVKLNTNKCKHVLRLCGGDSAIRCNRIFSVMK